MKFFNKIFGDPNKKTIDKLKPIVQEINDLESEFEKLPDSGLKEKTREWQKKIKHAKNRDEEEKIIEEILPATFALVREGAKRTLSQRHFDCQLMGGIILHRGEIAEMRTGEGKTLTATLPIYLNALSGRGVHVITVNDYLSKRDAIWMGQIYDLLGLSVSCVSHDEAFVYQNSGNRLNEKRDAGVEIVDDFLRKATRKEAYQADIIYGTNNEFGFDYLRDNMVQNKEQEVQRELNYAVIDEIDSILIDEARTPLIISAPTRESTQKYYQFTTLVEKLSENEDYNIDEKMRAATLSEKGIEKMEKWLGVENIYTAGGIRDVHYIEQALRARALFKKDRDYVVKDGEVVIVDEFTGRMLFGRRYSEGLHQAIEAKEGLKIQQESITLATVTFQNYFRLYNKLSGMTGTAITEAEEFSKIYKLDVTIIPTNKQMIRKDMADRIYKNERGKFTAIIKEIKKHNNKGQPILVGTISIEKNELLGRMLDIEGVKYELLNAKNHEREAKIIANAGKIGAVTVATNMAGRGVDIVLGGAKENFDSDEEWQKEYEKVISAGGLYILGTERHESRRIDNQLRGRSGRQGDAGESRFFVSMEDDLMRIFGGERMKGIMERFNFPEDMPIENKLISRSIEQSQKKVEGNNFDIRKHLVEYDDVINKHRETVYAKRKNILLLAEKRDIDNNKIKPESEISNFQFSISQPKADQPLAGNQINKQEIIINNSLSDVILEMVRNEIEQVVMFHTADDDFKKWDLKEIYETVNTIFPLPQDKRLKVEDIPVCENSSNQKIELRTKIIDYLIKLAKKNYGELEQKISSAGINFIQIEKEVILRSIDNLWIEHLGAMDHLRTGIGLRGYGQQDPLVEYKKEAYRLFTELMNLIQKQAVYTIYKIGLTQDFAPTIMQADNIQVSNVSSTGIIASEAQRHEKSDNIPDKTANQAGKKVGRNDPCPCGAKKPDGSPKKYKHCCGK